MFDVYQICPYTGLRSFTEEESLYFKGREEHIEQATLQLQRNKFLMLTGASGDGKSSLVYAGIVPNAKAGFLKSKYSQWCVADFRPERAPFKNLCQAVAQQLGIDNATTVESELQHGFSALIDLYKNSSLFVDVDSSTWKHASEAEQAVMKREAGNLILLVDQFEEFFTNPENYQRGVPSRDSNLVLNLLLETARIALEENLPVYVVFTMRSDYIGQCAAFRGLPEYIGFSQFFVPRLNRSQLQQVIEEPAILSGNKITRRLTERLIHDISEGVDQLPILQHALNQIWVAAENGTEEMDLIHYAMVGGMPVDELPDEDAVKFKKWFEALPEKIRECYHEPDLENVLDTHTNKLYEEATDYYKTKTGKVISVDDTKLIIKKAFTCLTKIDQGRAVRNRMTLQEITEIIDRPDLNAQVVGDVLNIFREPGNTFIRPFIMDDPESAMLHPDRVLDITHESLIRNWDYLEQWAKEEFENHTVSLDFDQQLRRWVKSNKSGAFLLSIGPLTYFENWYDKTKPNDFWIARYLSDEGGRDARLKKARGVLVNANEFLRRSKQRHLVTRTVMRYGAKRIAAVLGGVVILLLSSFATVGYLQRQNNHVLGELENKVSELSANPRIFLRSRALLLCEELKLGLTTIPEEAGKISDSVERINLVTGIATVLVFQGRGEPAEEIYTALALSDSLLTSIPPTDTRLGADARVLHEINDLRETLELAYFYNPAPRIKTLIEKNAKRSAVWTLFILRTQPEKFTNIPELNIAMEHAINYKSFSSAEVTELIGILSPFDNQSPVSWVSTRYKKSNLSPKGFYDYGFSFNGYYQELAYLYAAAGDVSHTLQSIDTLLFYNERYFQRDYSTMPDNAAHVAACFYRYGFTNELSSFVSGYASKAHTTDEAFYSRLLARCKLYEFATTVLDWDPNYGFDLNLSLEFNDDKMLTFFFSRYRETLTSIKNDDERNFLMALSYKDEGILNLRKIEVKGYDSLATNFYPLLDKAMQLYFSVSQKYRDETVGVIEKTNNDNFNVARKFLFLFPDIRTPFHPNEPRLYHFFYTTGYFLKYIFDKDLFERLYSQDEEQSYFAHFFRDYCMVYGFDEYTASFPISYEVLAQLESKLTAAGAERFTNLDALYLYAGHGAALSNDPQATAYYYGKLTTEKTKALFINSFDPRFQLRLVGDAITDLSRFGMTKEADRLIKMFDNSENRSSLYAFASSNLLRDSLSNDKADALIDSSRIEMERVTDGDNQSGRILLAFSLSLRNEEGDVEEARRIMKNIQTKFIGLQRISGAYGYQGELYNGVNNIPESIAGIDYTLFAWHILYGYSNNQKDRIDDKWHVYSQGYISQLISYINYVDDKQ